MRIGTGYDLHPLRDGRKLVIGGVHIEHPKGLDGHSDADVLTHAVIDAILGAAGLGDIGEMFSDADPANKGRDSIEMLRVAAQRVQQAGFTVQNVDVVVVAEHPRVGPHRDAMRARLAAALGVDVSRVSVKGKSNEGMGWIGRGEGIACIAVAAIVSART